MKRGRAELALLAGSLLFVMLLAAAAELAVRAFSSVGLLGNSKNLFVANAYGKSHGNAHDVEASSFGLTVYTDAHGFRVPKGGVPGDEQKSGAILILGDSVGFGPAVEEPETIAGLLRAQFPARRIYNASVIGYGTPDYRNVAEAFVPAHPEIVQVVLVYCLNDVGAGSAANIERYLNQEQPGPSAKGLTETLRSFRLLSDANDFLRTRSKLYLFIRHHLLQTQTRDWRAIAQQYAEGSDGVERSARDIEAIAALLAQRGIPFLVVLSPFEYQLRNPADPEVQLPQRRIGELLARAGIRVIDPRPSFDASRRSVDYFLPYDSMHFSAAGHRVMADVIAAALRNQRDRLAR
jgi:lysophospholipase L1-like esterase